MMSFWTVLDLAGLWGFVLCTVGFIFDGFPARGLFDGRKALKWGALLVLCFAAWIIGMANAGPRG